MTTTLTYVGKHSLVSSAASSLVKLSLLNNLEVEYSAEPRPLDLHISSLAVTVEGLLLYADQQEDWNFQQDLALLLETLDHPDWNLVTLSHSGLYEVVTAVDDASPSRVIAHRLAGRRAS